MENRVLKITDKQTKPFGVSFKARGVLEITRNVPMIISLSIFCYSLNKFIYRRFSVSVSFLSRFVEQIIHCSAVFAWPADSQAAASGADRADLTDLFNTQFDS